MSYFNNLAWIWRFIVTAFSFSSKTPENTTGCSQTEMNVISLNEERSVALPLPSSSPKTDGSYWIAIPKALGFQFHKKKLVLDLDETLISSSQKHCFKHDISVEVMISGYPATFFVRKRPHVDLFLETVSQWFEVIIFTASLSVYANAVIDQLDPKGRINRRYYRQSCTNKGGSYIKELQTVCKDLSKVVLVDNSPVAFSYNKENGIAIPDYFGTNPQDESLLHLLPLLEKIRDADDVRQTLKAYPNGVCGIKSSEFELTKKSNQLVC